MPVARAALIEKAWELEQVNVLAQSSCSGSPSFFSEKKWCYFLSLILHYIHYL
jgi:hypothetical protein